MTDTDNVGFADRIGSCKNVPAETVEVHIAGGCDRRFAMPTEVECPAMELARKLPRDRAPSPAMEAGRMGEQQGWPLAAKIMQRDGMAVWAGNLHRLRSIDARHRS
jgi:hypothetical protein